MTQEDKEKIQILNLLMWLQVSVFSADECSTIGWFNKHQTKMLLKRLVDTINKEHGPVLKGLWDTPGANIDVGVSDMIKFSELVSRIPYYKLDEINILLQKFIDGENNT